MFPPEVEIDDIIPVNLFYHPRVDWLAGYLPGARYFSRWIIITGRKTAGHTLKKLDV
jgi:hypothetical protein